jgi:hypothetical protein
LLYQAKVSMTRIRTFLLKDEIDLTQINKEYIAGKPCLFNDVDLGWSHDSIALKK